MYSSQRPRGILRVYDDRDLSFRGSLRNSSNAHLMDKRQDGKRQGFMYQNNVFTRVELPMARAHN